jgi:hypothetical protein
VQAPGQLRARSFGAPVVEPAFTKGRPAHTIAPQPASAQPTPALAAAPPAPASPLAPATAPEVWSARGFSGVFDPNAAERPVPPPVRLDHAVPTPAPREDTAAPPQ